MEPPVRGVAASSTLLPRHPTRSPPPDRYLSFSSPTSSTTGGGEELTEDDIFSTAIFSTASEPSSNPIPNHPPRHHHHHSFGILAALPSSETLSVFNHKASSSSSRMLPIIPNPRRPKVVEHRGRLMHQSAPVSVPVLSAAVEAERRRRRGVDDDEEDGDGIEVEMLPPHEIVAARETPMMACSVLEGVGRTLKGRDLRRVRNAIWRKTGFLD